MRTAPRGSPLSIRRQQRAWSEIDPNNSASGVRQKQTFIYPSLVARAGRCTPPDNTLSPETLLRWQDDGEFSYIRPWCRAASPTHGSGVVTRPSLGADQGASGNRRCSTGPWSTCKGLRDGFGVNAIHRNVPLHLVQRWLGHANIATTTIYTEVIGPEEQEIASRMWP